MIADGLVLAMDNSGRVALAEAAVDRYQSWPATRRSRDSHDTCGPMSLAGGRLMMHNLTT